jgi:hypothetical protein
MKYTSFVLAILLIMTGSFSCCWDDEKQKEKCQVVVGPSGHSFIDFQPWIYDFVDECMDSEFNGRMYTCIYRDGFGFLAESYENTDTVYSLYDCEGMVLYEEMVSPVNSRPELKIERKGLVFGMYPPIWKEIFDVFECNYDVNPFNLPRVKAMILASCFSFTHYCSKSVSIFSYNNDIGFYLHWAANSTFFEHFEYLDCYGNVLCTQNHITGESIPCTDDMGIDFENENNQKRKLF